MWKWNLSTNRYFTWRNFFIVLELWWKNQHVQILHYSPPCSHILHTYQPSHSPQRHQPWTTLNDLFMNTPALFKCNDASTCNQHSNKSNIICPHIFLLHLLKYLPFFLLLLVFCMSKYHPAVQVTFQDGILLNTFQASSMLPCMLSLSVPKLAHALFTWTKWSPIAFVGKVALPSHAAHSSLIL